MTFWLLWALFLNVGDTPASGGCVSCHPSQAREHFVSRHAGAWTNDLFRHEYDPSPKAWCVSCHAPDVPETARSAPPAGLAKPGVGCTSCHIRDGQLVSRTRSPQSIHATRTDPEFGGAAMCSSCHQFNFPVLGEGGTLDHYTALPMQNTVAEYRASGSTLSCSSCHMRRGHQFVGSHDKDTLRRALDIELCRSSKGVVVVVDNRGTAHNVPSGGVHRHIAVSVWRSSAPSRVWLTRLGRTFGPRADGSKRLASDTTIPAGQRRSFAVDAAKLGGSAAAPINVRFDYVFQAPDAVDPATAPEPTLSFWERRVRLADLPRCSARGGK